MVGPTNRENPEEKQEELVHTVPIEEIVPTEVADVIQGAVITDKTV